MCECVSAYVCVCSVRGGKSEGGAGSGIIKSKMPLVDKKSLGKRRLSESAGELKPLFPSLPRPLTTCVAPALLLPVFPPICLSVCLFSPGLSSSHLLRLASLFIP